MKKGVANRFHSTLWERLSTNDNVSSSANERLRNSLRLSICNILNTCALESGLSVPIELKGRAINFGILDLNEFYFDPEVRDDFTDMLREAISRFEPRVDKQSLRVSISHGANNDPTGKVDLEIDCQLSETMLSKLNMLDPFGVTIRATLDISAGSSGQLHV